MKLVHHLKTSSKEIPLEHDGFSTKHVLTSSNDILHKGWIIHTKYAGDDARYSTHKYDIQFTVEDAREFRDALDEMLRNFEPGTLNTLLGGEDG